jgi:hypothetical protein
MSKKVVTTKFACGICETEFETREAALECEKQGVALPEFKRFEVVEFVNLSETVMTRTVSGFQTLVQNGTKAVIYDNAKEGQPDPHLLPLAYDVWLYTPGAKIGNRDSLRELALVVEQNLLKRVGINNDNCCPLCGSGNVATTREVVAYDYLGLRSGLPLLKEVEVQKCSNCTVTFLTTAQSRKIDQLVRQRCKWPIANTKKLIRNHEFDYLYS